MCRTSTHGPIINRIMRGERGKTNTRDRTKESLAESETQMQLHFRLKENKEKSGNYI